MATRMATREEYLAEIYERYKAGTLSPEKAAFVKQKMDEYRTGLEPTPEQTNFRQQAMSELAEEVGPLQAFLIGAGSGLTTIGRGVGLVEPAGEIEKEAIGALKEQRPYTTGAGEIAGEAAPFLIPGTAAGRIAALPARALASGAVGGAEGAIIQRGMDGTGIEGAGVGAAVGMGAELLFPMLGRLGRKVYQRVTGRAPKGAMLDAAGQPTAELQEALDTAGMTFDDLTQDATEVISKQQPGAIPEQVARAALFTEEGIPATTGEITKGFEQLATEQRLLESTADVGAEPFRQFKLRQSEAIKENLRKNFNIDVDTEETGQLIKDALIGRKKLLRTQKNDLYRIASEKAEDIGGLPVFTDNIGEAIPDADLLEDLAITAPGAMKSLDQILVKYGLKEPVGEVDFTPTPLTIDNFERFRKTLNAIARGDQTGAANVAINPIKNALDTEVAELGMTLKPLGISDEITKPLLEARKTVRQLKTEFSPQAITGRISDVKKDGITPIIEASKIYDKLVGKALPVEETRRVMKSLGKSKEGQEAIASIQTSTIMDLIDAGFGTESRKISGIKTFNPIAFKRRLNSIGDKKMKALFANNKQVLKKLNNIDKIATELVPPSGATPKGSASVVLDLANKLGLASISTKIPGGALVVGALRSMAEPVKKGIEVQKALKGQPEVRQLISQFPGLSSAFGIAAITETEEE